jgi:hypothetical protein
VRSLASPVVLSAKNRASAGDVEDRAAFPAPAATGVGVVGPEQARRKRWNQRLADQLGAVALPDRDGQSRRPPLRATARSATMATAPPARPMPLPISSVAVAGSVVRRRHPAMLAPSTTEPSVNEVDRVGEIDFWVVET